MDARSLQILWYSYKSMCIGKLYNAVVSTLKGGIFYYDLSIINITVFKRKECSVCRRRIFYRLDVCHWKVSGDNDDITALRVAVDGTMDIDIVEYVFRNEFLVAVSFNQTP